MRTTLVAQGYANSCVAREIWEGTIKRSFQRRPQGLRARLARDLVQLEVRTQSGEVAGHLPGIATDGKRAMRVLKKIVRGIYFQEHGRTLGDDELLVFRDAETKGLDFEARTQGWPEIDMGEPFRYRSQHSPEGSMVWFEFYRTNWWLAMTGDFARNYKIPT
jgi:hypothetical protein